MWQNTQFEKNVKFAFYYCYYGNQKKIFFFLHINECVQDCSLPCKIRFHTEKGCVRFKKFQEPQRVSPTVIKVNFMKNTDNTFIHVQCSPFIMLYLGSIRMVNRVMKR